MNPIKPRLLGSGEFLWWTVFTAGEIKHMQLHWQRTLGSLYVFSPGLDSMHFFPILTLLLQSFIIINVEYDYMLSPVRPRKLPNLSLALGISQHKQILNSLRARTIPNNKILSTLEKFKIHCFEVPSNVDSKLIFKTTTATSHLMITR